MSSSSSISDSSSDEEQLPAKKPFLSYHDLDQSASSVHPPLSVASSDSATVLRRSLRKIIEESKRDAASSSVSISRESTPPRVSGSGRRISSRKVFSPASSSQSTRMSKDNNGSRSTMSCRSVIPAEMTSVAKQLDFWRRSGRVRKVNRTVNNATKSVPSGTVSSDDDTTSLKESGKVCVSDLIANRSRLASRIDTSDTDSRASSLCASSTRSAVSSAVKLKSRTGASAKQKNGRPSQVFKCVADELSKLQSSDSETDGQTYASRTTVFDSFPENSSNGSSICSSVPAAELSTDRTVRTVDICKNSVGRSSQAKETSVMKLDPDGADLNKKAEFETDEKKQHSRSELKAKSPINAATESIPVSAPEIQSSPESKVTCFQNENDRDDKSENSVSNSLMQKGQLSGENGSAASTVEDSIIETNQKQKEVNCGNLEITKDDTKIKESVDEEPRVTDQAEHEEAKKSDVHSTCDGNVEQDIDEKVKEEVDDVSNVKEEPPEILVSLTHL